MTNEEAIQICRSPERSVRDAKRVLRWAASDPIPEKISFLLLLNSDAFAAVKGFYEELERVLAECAKDNPTALWESVYHDWEGDRITLAARVLLADLNVDTSQVLQLARTKVIPGVWALIKRWAHSVGFKIPIEVADQQERWERELKPGGTTDNAYADLAKRKPVWPAEKDLARPRPTPPARRTQGYGERKTELTHSLNRILSWIDLHRPDLAAALEPGLSADEIALQAGVLPFILPEEAYELYSWRNASRGERQVTLVPYFRFLQLEEAIDYYTASRELSGFREKWFPLFDWNGEEVICLECRNQEMTFSPVIRHDYESGTRTLSANLSELMRMAAENYESGRYFMDENGAIAE